MAAPSSSSSADSALSVTVGFSTSICSLPLVRHMQVRHVAGMRALRVHQAVLGLVGIEMRAGRFEVGRLAFADGMDMEGVLAGGDRGQVEIDQHAARG